MVDVVAMGEFLIDFAPVPGVRTFQANPGGAPANVLAAVVKLGGSGAFIGMVGKDDFGTLLQDTLRNAGIDGSGLKFTEEACTTLAFVQLDEHGDRSFTFVRKPGADLLLRWEDVNTDLIDNCRIFHFGSVSMSGSPARETNLKAAQYAREKGKMVSFDPNLRPPLWNSLDRAKSVINEGIGCCDILKISEEELEFLTGSSDLEKGSAAFLERGVTLVLVTLGPKGCFYRCAGGCGTLPTYDVKVVDTTGAGDAFFGGVLSKLSKLDKAQLAGLTKEACEEIVDFGNRTGSLATIQKGAIPAMPSMEYVLNLNVPILK